MTINNATRNFILSHRNDDIRLLALRRTDADDVDMPVALEQIAGWQTARRKLPSWTTTEGIVYPPRLSMEQCSGEAAARYKQDVIRRLTNGRPQGCDVGAYPCGRPSERRCVPTGGGMMCDLTGGAGVDFSFIAPLFNRAVYVERQEHLCDIARTNMPLLGVENAEIICADAADFLRTIDHVTLLFLDPARRDSTGRRTYAIADCTPDVRALRDTLLDKADFVMLKLSPMLDVNKTIADLNAGMSNNIVREVHIVAIGNECKEILVVLSTHNIQSTNEEMVATLHVGNSTPMPSLQRANTRVRPYNAGDPAETPPRVGATLAVARTRHMQPPVHDNYDHMQRRATTRVSPYNADDPAEPPPTCIVCVNDNRLFVYNRQEADEGSPTHEHQTPTHEHLSPTPGLFLYEPNAAIMKAGCFNLLCQRFNMRPIASNSHLFISEKPIADFPGRRFMITAVSTMNKKSLKAALNDITHANISVRNFPLSAEELRRRLRLKAGGDVYLFATTAPDRRLIIIITHKA